MESSDFQESHSHGHHPDRIDKLSTFVGVFVTLELKIFQRAGLGQSAILGAAASFATDIAARLVVNNIPEFSPIQDD